MCFPIIKSSVVENSFFVTGLVNKLFYVVDNNIITKKQSHQPTNSIHAKTYFILKQTIGTSEENDEARLFG